MGKVDLIVIVKVLKDWRETADNFGVDSSQAKEKGAIAMPLLFENRELLPESNQRFQLRGLEGRFTIDEIKTMNDGGNCDFYADKNFIADLVNAEQNAILARGSKRSNFLWKLYEKTLKVIVDAVMERLWPKQ